MSSLRLDPFGFLLRSTKRWFPRNRRHTQMVGGEVFDRFKVIAF